MNEDAPQLFDEQEALDATSPSKGGESKAGRGKREVTPLLKPGKAKPGIPVSGVDADSRAVESKAARGKREVTPLLKPGKAKPGIPVSGVDADSGAVESGVEVAEAGAKTLTKRGEAKPHSNPAGIVCDGSDNALEPEDKAVATPSRLFILTNQQNLRRMLSARMIVPREDTVKYYADLFERTPGLVPILTRPPTASQLSKVVSEQGSGSPVLLELDASVLNDEAQDAPIVYVRSVLLAQVKAIHFKDDKSLRNHRSKRFDNIHSVDNLCRIDSDLFDGASGDDIEVIPTAVIADVDWTRLDRIRGALNAAVATVQTGEALATVGVLLGATRVPSVVVLPPWLTWQSLSEAPVAHASESPAEMADRILFEVAYRVLGEADQSAAWSPALILDAVAMGIASVGPGEEVVRILNGHLGRTRDLVGSEVEFTPFAKTDVPCVARRALLMVLLRPKLDELLNWPSTETGADAVTRMVAAILAGRLRGVARESVKLRNMTFDDLTAAWAIRNSAGDSATIGEVEFAPSQAKIEELTENWAANFGAEREGTLGLAQLIKEQGGTRLNVNGIEIARAPALMPDILDLYRALGVRVRGRFRIMLSEYLGWEVEQLVQGGGALVVDQGDGFIKFKTASKMKIERFVDEEEFCERLQDAPPDVLGRIFSAT